VLTIHDLLLPVDADLDRSFEVETCGAILVRAASER
jgi:hypothetical protein